MFNFLAMIGTHEQRKVKRFESGALLIDTCSVTDGNRPFETGISHPEYNGADWIIVEAYNDTESAQEGHDKWVLKMTTEPLPNSLEDCKNSEIATLIDRDLVFPRLSKNV